MLSYAGQFSQKQNSALSARNDKKWELVWADEFNKPRKADPANWNFEHGFVRNEEYQWYQADNAFCKNVVLVIEGRKEQIKNPNYDPTSNNWRTKRR